MFGQWWVSLCLTILVGGGREGARLWGLGGGEAAIGMHMDMGFMPVAGGGGTGETAELVAGLSEGWIDVQEREQAWFAEAAKRFDYLKGRENDPLHKRYFAIAKEKSAKKLMKLTGRKGEMGIPGFINVPSDEEPEGLMDYTETSSAIVGCLFTNVGHIEGDLLLRVVINEICEWEMPFPRDDEACFQGDFAVRKALIDLPKLPDGTHYICVSCIVPSFKTPGMPPKDVVIAAQGAYFTLLRYRIKSEIKSEVLDFKICHSSNTTAPCLVCGRTIHNGGKLCSSADEEAAASKRHRRLPTYYGNKMNAEPGAGWYRQC